MKKLIFVPSSAGANGDQIIEKNFVTNHMEANIKTITVKDGIGREVNPYSPYDPIHQPNSDLSRFDYFAKHNVGYPCPELANTEPGETVEAELVWQYKSHGDVWKFISDEKRLCGYQKIPIPTRYAWKLVPEQKQQKTIYDYESMKATNEKFKPIARKYETGQIGFYDAMQLAFELALTPPTLK